MLNLEEIQMSEEELINSYDPHNEENNYHLPNHIYQRLQLGHYRQECSEVIPRALYISGHQVAGDIQCLQRHEITHIVNMAADVCESRFPDRFSYLTYYLKDANSEELSPLFYRTLEWIQNAISGGGRVLVHCREGVSRSATMVIAYLMWRSALTFEAAHELLRKARPICNPNTGFTCQLLVLGKRLGVGGQMSSPLDRTQLYRITAHHHREPFLLLMPQEWQPPAPPSLDPRFGWVVQRGATLILWLGSAVPDPGPVREAAAQHAQLVERFEGRSLRLSEAPEGSEPPEFWQALGQAEVPAAGPGSLLAALRPALDAEFEVLKAAASAAACAQSPGGEAGQLDR